MASSSYAELTTTAVLENPQKVTASGKAYVPIASNKTVKVSLRFFNRDDLEIPDVGVYPLFATFVCNEQGVKVFVNTPTKFGFVVSDSNKATGTFNINGEQYTTPHYELGDEKLGAFSAHFMIPNIPRFARNKPIPFNKCMVMVSGHLNDITSSLDNEGKA
ncbi:hypothetical protein GGX14DRAFT_557098 [Mycena pura]|uniref:Uncharacterized protein n=1 Tax=Mycena pura TaxID=153505 RepID=A0AAD6YN14_9AGAR|nr:hypothetical protein GGX14DRAFT_557098 [Mycena pura]